MNYCACGCGNPAKKSFVTGHNLRVMERTEAHRKAIGLGQKRAWANGRKHGGGGRHGSEQKHVVGDRYTDRRGYIHVKTEPDQQWRRWPREHHVVMEQSLGRKLLPGELVHHINGVRDDNRPENLHLVASRTAHNEIHRSLDRVVRHLIANGLVIFHAEREEYEAVLPG